MDFESVRTKTAQCFHEIRAHLSHISSLEPEDAQTPMPLEAKILNGFFYVGLYAAIEQTINDIVLRSITSISLASIQQNHLLPSFYTVSLHSDMMGIRDSGSGKFLAKSNEFYSKLAGTHVVTMNETCLSLYLQNVGTETINQVFDAFGIARLKIDPAIGTTVNEVKDHRNKVAHGREPASSVGERHRVIELRRKSDQVAGLLAAITDAFERYHLKKGYIRSAAKHFYRKAV